MGCEALAIRSDWTIRVRLKVLNAVTSQRIPATGRTVTGLLTFGGTESIASTTPSGSSTIVTVNPLPKPILYTVGTTLRLADTGLTQLDGLVHTVTAATSATSFTIGTATPSATSDVGIASPTGSAITANMSVLLTEGAPGDYSGAILASYMATDLLPYVGYSLYERVTTASLSHQMDEWRGPIPVIDPGFGR